MNFNKSLSAHISNRDCVRLKESMGAILMVAIITMSDHQLTSTQSRCLQRLYPCLPSMHSEIVKHYRHSSRMN